MSHVVYCAQKDAFIDDVYDHLFISKMQEGASLYHIGYGPSELVSWTNNAQEIQNLLIRANLPADTYIAFEYRVPHGSGRIDCMLFGKGTDDRDNVVHIELKQWSNKTVSELYSTGVFKVEALTGRHYRPVPHPSQQVANYQQYLKDYEVVFQGQCNLEGLAYCYNYRINDTPRDLYADHYKAILDQFPLYSGDQSLDLALRLNSLLAHGDGLRIFNNVRDSPICPSKNLMDAAANMFRGITEFNLLDDQLAASNTIFAEIDRTIKEKEKTVIIVKGGPGTGKTVIALHILAQLAQQRQYTNCFFTTRSKALRNNLKLKLRNIQVNNQQQGDAGNLIRNIYAFKPYHYKESEIDVLLVDEAHRISKSSNHMSDRRHETTYLSQVLSLIYCSKVCVFFIDDKQAITNSEIGTSEMIRESAENYLSRMELDKQVFLVKIQKEKNKLARYKQERVTLLARQNEIGDRTFIHELTQLENRILKTEAQISKETCINDVKASFDGKITILDFELKSQFRCNGADNYLDWLDDVLYLPMDQIQSSFRKNDYDFQIFDSPQVLYDQIRALDRPADNPNQSARLAAGYCWDWKGELTPEGDLKKEVVIGDFKMPWETLTPAREPYRSQYASSADTWAIEPEGINQIGCIFSIQGLEIDYIGVILGPDIDYDPVHNSLKAVPGITHNMNAGNDSDRYVKNIYRVLMSRGKKGCYVFCTNKAVSDYLKRCVAKGK